ncbi:MAG: type III polyketide synthase [Gemmatimonadales bacterium]
MTLALTGFGTRVPAHSITQDEAVEIHSTLCEIDEGRARTLRALYRRSGVSKRHSVLLERSCGPLPGRQSFYAPARDEADPGPTTASRMLRYEAEVPALASAAACEALTSAGTRAAEVTHLVTVSCTGFVAPGIDTRVIEALGLPASTQRTHVGFMGCHGALNGLKVADSLVRADPDAVVVVCSVELCSLHFSYGWHPEMMVPNALFADGAAAVVGRAGDVARGAWTVASLATLLIPDTADDMSWRIGDHGFRMTLSARVPQLIEDNLGTWLRRWLAENGLSAEDVASWAIHPGGPRILSAVEAAAGLERERTRVSRAILAEYGNMSSATVLFTLDRLRAENAPRPCVALALGPGLIAEAALIV